MFTKINKVLGIAVEDNQILLAELHQSGSGYRVTQSETYTFQSDSVNAEPDQWVADLQKFLEIQKFSAKDAIVGFPAKWLLVKKKEIPTIANDALGNVVQLMAEREFALDMNDLVLDYFISQQSPANMSLLVMATLRRRMENILGAVRAAGLNVRSVTSSTLGFLSTTNPQSSSIRYLVYLRPEYAEIVEQHGFGFRAIQHLALTHNEDEGVDSYSLGLSRQLNNYFMLSGHLKTPAEINEFVIWNGAGASAISQKTLQQNLNRPFDIRNGFDEVILKNRDWKNTTEVGTYVAPVFLAAAGLQNDPIAIDFIHSKVTAHKKSSHKKTMLYSAIAMIMLLIAGFAIAWSWQQDRQTIATITAQLEENKTEIEVAETLSEKISLVKTWYTTRPKVLDCMLELTYAFPEEGTIWVSSLALREDMRGIITGVSQNESVFLNVLDKMNKTSVFSNPKMLYLRNTGRNSQDLAFAVDFYYTNGKIQNEKIITNNTSDEEAKVMERNSKDLNLITQK